MQTLVSRRLDTPLGRPPFMAPRGRQPVPFERTVEAILLHDDLPSGARLVAVAIAHLNQDNRMRVTLERIQQRTGLGEKTVIGHLHTLEGRGVLKIAHGHGPTPNRYAVMIPQPFSA